VVIGDGRQPGVEHVRAVAGWGCDGHGHGRVGALRAWRAITMVMASIGFVPFRDVLSAIPAASVFAPDINGFLTAVVSLRDTLCPTQPVVLQHHGSAVEEGTQDHGPEHGVHEWTSSTTAESQSNPRLIGIPSRLGEHLLCDVSLGHRPQRILNDNAG
jgi:hypothetical protein